MVDTGRPVAQVARELDVYESSLGRWVAQLRADRGETDALTTDERARLGELEREVADLRMERDLLKRSVAFWVSGPPPCSRTPRLRGCLHVEETSPVH